MSSNKEPTGNRRGFTIIEMIIGITIAIILLSGIGFFMATLEGNISSVGTLEKVITEKEDWERDLVNLSGNYSKILFESGNIITKSNAGFENIIYSNVAETGGLMVGVLDYNTNKIVISSDYKYKRYAPFMAILDAAQITALKSDYNAFIATFSGKKQVYFDLPIISFGHYILSNGIEKYDMNFTLLTYANLIGKDLYDIYSEKNSDIYNISIIK